MALHPLHSVTFNDGTNIVVLEPPRWRSMSYEHAPVGISSLFESYDGSAVKQLNVGAVQKWRIRITITGCREPIVSALFFDRTWDVTMIKKDSIEEEETITCWPVEPVQQSINPQSAERSWSIELREQ